MNDEITDPQPGWPRTLDYDKLRQGLHLRTLFPNMSDQSSNEMAYAPQDDLTNPDKVQNLGGDKRQCIGRIVHYVLIKDAVTLDIIFTFHYVKVTLGVGLTKDIKLYMPDDLPWADKGDFVREHEWRNASCELQLKKILGDLDVGVWSRLQGMYYPLRIETGKYAETFSDVEHLARFFGDRVVFSNQQDIPAPEAWMLSTASGSRPGNNRSQWLCDRPPIEGELCYGVDPNHQLIELCRVKKDKFHGGNGYAHTFRMEKVCSEIAFEPGYMRALKLPEVDVRGLTNTRVDVRTYYFLPRNKQTDMLMSMLVGLLGYIETQKTKHETVMGVVKALKG